MKQLFFMIPAMIVGTVGNFNHPYLGIAVYYIFAVLRPQFIWVWALPEFAWSFYVAVTTMLMVVLSKVGIFSIDDTASYKSWNIGHISVIGFGVWISLTYFTARSQLTAYPFFIEYLKLFAMFIVARYAITEWRQLWRIHLCIIFTLIYIAYEINEAYFSRGYLFVYWQGYGGLDNNGAALMLAMGVPLCFYAWDGILHWVRWGFILAVPVIIHAVLTSYSRGAMVSLIVIIPIFVIRAQRRAQVLIMLALVMATIPFLAGKEIQDRFFTIQKSEVDESANSRRTSWAIGWRMAMENPIFGMGIRNSNLFTFAYGADMEGRTIHSQWIQTAADSGIVALILYISMFVAMLYCASKVRRSYRGIDSDEANKMLMIVNGCEGALLLFCVGATFLSLENFELPYILLLIVAQAWTLASASQQERLETEVHHDENIVNESQEA
jgi:probable O-glycosylation ligase (exosortase A-associated)